jgi:hypothetical protein
MNEFSIPDISSFSDAELEAHCTKFFPHTRPKKNMDFAITNLLSNSTQKGEMTEAQKQIAASLESMKPKKLHFGIRK